MTPGEGPDNATTAVTIAGDGFAPRVITDFTRKGSSRLEDGYTARLGSAALTGVTRTDGSTISAVVPVGLAAGLYDLTVVDPYGREVVLTGAFAVKAVGVPAALAFTTASYSVQAGACSPLITVRVQDGLGQPALVNASVVVSLTGSSVGTTFFSDAACANPITEASITAGTLSASFYLRATAVGPLTVTALALGLTSAVQSHTILSNGATSLAFSTPALTLTQAACSTAVTLELRDALGNAASERRERLEDARGVSLV